MKVPKYQLVQNELRQQIISGKFENGDKFYTEAELTKLYNVSSITVIRAMNELVKDGYLIRQQGKGTFVSRSRKGKLVKFSDIEIFSTDEDRNAKYPFRQDRFGPLFREHHAAGPCRPIRHAVVRL